MEHRKRIVTLANKRAAYGYFFILPFVIGFVLFVLSPVLLFGVMGFSKATAGVSNIEMTPVGWENYETILFQEPDFLQNTASSLGKLMITGTSVLIFSFFISVVLNQKFFGRGLARAVFFLPVVIASGAGALNQSDALSMSAMDVLSNIDTALGKGDSSMGLAGLLMNMLGFSVDSGFYKIIGAVLDRFYTIVMMSGVQILVFLAGLQGISSSLYEAARIDGATGWESFWKITFPLISPLILVNSVYTVVDYMNGSTGGVVGQINEYVASAKYGLGSAMGTVYFGVVFVVLGIVFAVISRFVVYDER